jgi:membrane-bound lytic murein transglycosylase D
MAKNPAQYGLDKVQPALPMERDTVRIDYPVDLRLVAECVDVDLDTLTELNPSLLRLTTPKDSTYDLRLPAGTKDKFQAAINAIPLDKRVAWRYHRVSPGDSLQTIAHQYHATPTAIEEVNNIQGTALEPDSKIIIPVAGGRGSSSPSEVAYSKRPTRYRVRRGDTVLSVADDFGVAPDRLRRWNRLKGNDLHSGKTLVIYRPVSLAQQTVINTPHVSHYRKKHKTTTAKSKTKKTNPANAKAATATPDHQTATLR